MTDKIDRLLALTPNRACGGCTQCCKTMKVTGFAANPDKPQNTWCKFCTVAKGCDIYDARPTACRDFTCLWLAGGGEEAMRPDRSKVVFTHQTDERVRAISPKGVLIAHVDPHNPDAWRQGAAGRYVSAVLQRGGALVVVAGERRTFVCRDPAMAAKFKDAMGEGNYAVA